ncbi:MAG: GMC family oxidoreductase [Bacteroidia bacterium]|nr:GMC family oxidoreductase [Bacteroidia bacterium]
MAEKTYDAIVIGSGASGGVAATNLFLAGMDVLLLEAGKRYDRKTFPRTEADYSTQLFWGGGLEFSRDARLAFMRGKCLGGTTIVNQCDLDRFDEIAFADWRAASGVDFFSLQAMTPYYDAVEKHLHIHQFTPDEYTENAKQFIRGCDAMGYRWGPLRRGQSDCRLQEGNDCIGCLGGCQLDSKQSTWVCFLKRVPDLPIETEFTAEKLEIGPETVKVHGTGREGEKTFLARKVVCAGGAFGNAALLHNSGLKKRLPALGKGFCMHPQLMFFGLFDYPINAHKGAFQSVCSHDPGFRKAGFKLENVYAPPISIAMLYAKTGREGQEFIRRYAYYGCIEAAIRDEPAGELSTDKRGRLVIRKTLTAQDESRAAQAGAVIRDIFEKAGAQKVVAASFRFGLHLMGGCAMGLDARTSVVGPDFALHGFKNVFIADSSVFPNAPGINPYFTIMALTQKMTQELTAR